MLCYCGETGGQETTKGEELSEISDTKLDKLRKEDQLHEDQKEEEELAYKNEVCR